MGTPRARGTRFALRGEPVHDGAVRLVSDRLRRVLPKAIAATVRRSRDRSPDRGWDLEYLDRIGQRVAIAVRATAATVYGAVDVSEAEWNAARRMGTRYWLVVVTSATRNPRLTEVQNPAGQVQDRTIDAVPTGWRLTWPARRDV